jgi:hypothetical protein
MTEYILNLIDTYRDACWNRDNGMAIISRRKIEAFITRYKKALEGLTPGGSEFVDDPERCATLIRSSRETQHGLLIKWKKDQNIKNENIRLAAQKVKAFFDRLEENSDDLLKDARKRYHAPVHAALDEIFKEVK